MDEMLHGAGFCFHCSVKNPFFVPIDRKLFYNPWPLLVPTGQPDLAVSQPLIRAVYLPMSDHIGKPDWEADSPYASWTMEDTRAALYEEFILLHEFEHLWTLDWTPAKELAKIYLAHSYSAVGSLLFARDDNRLQQTWTRFQFWSRQLRDIVDQIRFVEEVVATVFPLWFMAQSVAVGHRHEGVQDLVAEVGAESLAQQETQFPGFRRASKGIMPLLSNFPAYCQYLLPLLQPVACGDGSNRLPWALDARESLGTVLTILEGTDNEHEITMRLSSLGAESSVTQDWHKVLALQLRLGASEPTRHEEIEYRRFARLLRLISRGITLEDLGDGPLPHIARRAAQRLVEGHARQFRLGSENLAVLFLREHAGRTFVQVSMLRHEVGFVEEHSAVMAIEAIRQQLLARRGFVCPYDRGQHRCRCGKGFQDGLLRLSGLAREGLFGAGEWSAPSCMG